MSSSYIEHTTKVKNTLQQTNKKVSIKKKQKNIHNRMNNNRKIKSMWNKNTYDGGTWTKERMQKVIPMNSHQSWAMIIDKTPSSNPYPSTINSVQEAPTQTTLSTLTINTPKQKGKNKET